jgi:hypothetical protein
MLKQPHTASAAATLAAEADARLPQPALSKKNNLILAS